MRYLALSPDDLPIRPSGYGSREAAQRSLAQWVKRFEAQGYYAAASGVRIPYHEILSQCQIQEDYVNCALALLVPRVGSHASHVIDPGSGVVADAEVKGMHLEVYFEGNRHGAINLQTFDDRVKHAAGRLIERYPTTARGHFRREEFHVVGVYHVGADLEPQNLVVTEPTILRQWLGLEDEVS